MREQGSKSKVLYGKMKRAVDLLLALSLLVALSPLFLALMGLLLLHQGKPVIFTQQRLGRFGRPFKIFKFRTMSYSESGADASSDSGRVTRLGGILRAASLDELPQLVNVVRGDMSLVGPRPLLVQYLEFYSDNDLLRMEVRPGMTGLAQVNGRNSLEWEEQFGLDLEYVRKWSAFLDARILLQTIPAMIVREGGAFSRLPFSR